MVSIDELRKFRIFGVSMFDFILGAVGLIIVFLIARAYHFPNLSVWPFVIAAIVLTIPVGIVFHVVFGTNTTLDSNLGLSYAKQ